MCWSVLDGVGLRGYFHGVLIRRHLEELPELGKSLHLALGVFAGVHIGHQAVIGQAMEAAKQSLCGHPPQFERYSVGGRFRTNIVENDFGSTLTIQDYSRGGNEQVTRSLCRGRRHNHGGSHKSRPSQFVTKPRKIAECHYRLRLVCISRIARRPARIPTSRASRRRA